MSIRIMPLSLVNPVLFTKHLSPSNLAGQQKWCMQHFCRWGNRVGASVKAPYITSLFHFCRIGSEKRIGASVKATLMGFEDLFRCVTWTFWSWISPFPKSCIRPWVHGQIYVPWTLYIKPTKIYIYISTVFMQGWIQDFGKGGSQITNS